MLKNYENYGPYSEFVKTGDIIVDVSTISFSNWSEHFYGILNIFRDGIETDFVQNTFIKVDFGVGIIAEFTVEDYFFNVIMWYLIVRPGNKIRPKHIFFEEAITRKVIKKYIDNHFVEDHRKVLPNIELNNIIDDALFHYSFIDEFSWYLAETMNLEDTIELMNASPEFDSIIHADLSSVPIEYVKDVGMEYTNKAIHIMKNAKHLLGRDHCLANSWRALEGINPKQFKEFTINIGSKPNGRGGVFPTIINKSFSTGGVDDLLSYMIDSSIGRIAQILSKNNVGKSGHFARILGLNNTDTKLYDDNLYDCDSKNYQEVVINNEKTLYMLRDRYYRLDPRGMEYIMKNERTLIGKKVYLRSPMTCASASRGQGVCYKCYGDLAYTNRDINIGKIAAEEISSKLTQILLSAKHLLETSVKKIEWSERFDDLFELEDNIVKPMTDYNFKDFYLIINQDAINLENEDDYKKSGDEEEDTKVEFGKEEGEEEDSASDVYNEYVCEFEVLTPNKQTVLIKPMKANEEDPDDKLYISNELNNIIRKKGIPVDGEIHIPMELLADVPLFFIIIHNNELSKTMDKLMDIIDKNKVTKKKDRHTLLQEFINTIIEGDLNVSSIHCEIILSNQIRDIEDILEVPDWTIPNAPYEMLTLKQALTNNASVVVSLLYQRLSKMLYNPLTFRKSKPSFLDLFFMVKPQEYLNSTDIISAVKDTNKEDNLINPITIHKQA